MLQLINEYLTWLSSSGRKRAAEVYRIHLQRFSTLTEKKIENITVLDVVSFRSWYEEKYSQTHANMAMVVVKGFLRYCREKNIRCVSPYFIKLKHTPPKSYPAVQKKDVQKILFGVRTNEFWSLEKHLLIRLLWETGARNSELCDMDVSMIHSRKNYALIPSKKTRQLRFIFWSKQTHYLLLKYLGVRICMNKNPALFITPPKRDSYRRGRITPRTLQRWVKEGVEKAGLRSKIVPHSFRHGKAHYVLNMGGTITDVNKILGHKTLESSLHYISLNATEISKIAQKFL